MKKMLWTSALATLGLAAAGLAYVSAFPVRRTVPALAPQAAQALLASVVSPAQGALSAGAHQRAPRTALMDVDNVHGLRFRIQETADLYVAVVTPFAPDPAHAGHMSAPTVPAYALVRHEGLGTVTDYPMTQVGSSWVAAVPKKALSLLPGDRIWAGVWGPGTNTSNPDEADSWQWWQL